MYPIESILRLFHWIRWRSHKLEADLLLSLFGLAVGVATVFIIPSNIEPLFWLAIFLLCAWLIALHAPGKLLTGPFVGMISGLVLGLFAFVAHKLVARRVSPATSS